jgi:UDP-N-acetylglucosamine acyltransferase
VFADRLGMVRADHGHDPLIAELLDFIAAPSERGLIQASLAGAVEADSV